MVNANLGILTTDRDLIVRSWDPWLAQAASIPAPDAIGKHLRDIVPDLESRGLHEFFNRALTEGVIEILAPRFHHYLIPCSPSVPSRRFEKMQQKVTIAPLKEENEPIGLIVTIEDATARLDQERDGSLIESFEHENWALRRHAVADMASQGSEEAVTGLLRALREQHRNPSVLNSALRVLTGSGLDTVSPLVDLLKDSDHELRMYAALALGDLKNPAAIPALIEMLGDEDINVRYHVIEALTKIKAPAAADLLLKIAESGDFFLAFPAIDALAQLEDPHIAVRLVPLLEDEMVRTSVVDALGLLGDEHVVEPIAKLLARPGINVTSIAQALTTLHERYEQQFSEGEHIADLVRRYAPPGAAATLVEALDESDSSRLRSLVRVIGWIDDAEVAGTLTDLLASGEVRKDVIEALVRHGKGVTQALTRQLESEDVEVRQSAILALGRIGDPESVPGLVRILTEDPELGAQAATALSRIGDSRAYSALMDLLGHPNAGVRQAVIGAVNSLGDPRTGRDVIGMISDPNPNLRESAIRIAGYFGYPECAPLIIASASDPDENVRRAAIESLPYTDNPGVVEVLLGALRQESPRIRAAAAQSLGYVESHEAVKALMDAFKDNDVWVRYYAARSVGRLAVPESVDSLVALARTDSAVPVRIAAAEALASIGGPTAARVLSSLLESDERDLASAAATGLGAIGHPDALPPLLAMMRSSDRNRRLVAIRAAGSRSDAEVVHALEWVAAVEKDTEVALCAIDELASIASFESLQSIVRLIAQPAIREACVAALSRVDNNHLEAIASGLAHPQSDVRRGVIEALSRKKHPKASELLASGLDDEDAGVRFAAVIALSRLGSHSAERKLARMISSDPDSNVRDAAQKALER